MALARGTSQSSEPTGQPLLHAISLRVQPKSELLSNAAAVPVVSHHARPRCVGLKSGFDRTTVRFVEEIRLSASVPTSTPFDFQYNKSGFSVSSATLLLLTQILVCCIDRLKPHRETVIPCSVLDCLRLAHSCMTILFLRYPIADAHKEGEVKYSVDRNLKNESTT